MKQLFKYFIISLLVAFIDAALSIFLFEFIGVNQIIATNVGIVVGFIIQYKYSVKVVFNCDVTRRTLSIFLFTWFLGIGIANVTVYILVECLNMAYTIGKLGSMGASFFILYGLRKKWLER